MDCLKAGSWNLEASIDFYYASGMANSAVSMDGKALETLFARYKGMIELLLTSSTCLYYCNRLCLRHCVHSLTPALQLLPACTTSLQLHAHLKPKGPPPLRMPKHTGILRIQQV